MLCASVYGLPCLLKVVQATDMNSEPRVSSRVSGLETKSSQMLPQPVRTKNLPQLLPDIFVLALESIHLMKVAHVRNMQPIPFMMALLKSSVIEGRLYLYSWQIPKPSELYSASAHLKPHTQSC
jgi:hypothetical protein